MAGAEIQRQAVAAGAKPGIAQQVTVALQQGYGRWRALEEKHRRRLGTLMLLLVALCAVVVWWSGHTQWRALFEGLNAQDMQSVQKQLGTAGISYRMGDAGDVEVPLELVDKARMAVAANGMPGSGRMGFEIFDRPNWVGSDFDEKVNYQRALEGELEHTIESLGPVRRARVHLVLPHDSLFVQQQRPATASVVLKLQASSIAPMEADSIRRLVAGAVDSLQPQAVVLVDADGRNNFAVPTATDAQRTREEEMERKLVAMLEPLAGVGNVRAVVNLQLDEGTEEHTEEKYDPQSAVPTSVQRSEESSSQPKTAGGAAGAVANTPAAKAPTDEKVTTRETVNSHTLREESSTYAVSKVTTQMEKAPGRILHMAAAIVVNDRALAKGTATEWKSRTPEEMRRMTELARAAVGFQPQRGDSVAVENISFSQNSEPVASGGAQWMERGQSVLRSNPTLLRMAGAVAVVLLIVFLVARPLVRGLALLPQTAAEGAMAALPGGSGPELMLPKPPPYNIVQLSEQVRSQPAQGKRILESWMGAETEVE